MAFDLSTIKKRKRLRAPKIVIYGPPKIGKTEFGASAPDSIGILTEDGTDGQEVSAFPLAKSFAEVLGYINDLADQQHGFKTAWVDTLDWLEPLILKAVCEEQKVRSIEDIGYGKGYIYADEKWKEFFEGLDRLRDKGMVVICIAHEQINKVKSPHLENDYDAYSLKLNKRATALVNEWADIIGFANYEIYSRLVDPGNKLNKDAKATGTGARRLFLNPNPAYIAGNRYGIPDCPLDWPSFSQAMRSAMTAAPSAA